MQNIDSIPISTDKRCYTVAELQKMLGISRGSVYQLLKTGQFHWFKIGTAFPNSALTNGLMANPADIKDVAQLFDILTMSLYIN